MITLGGGRLRLRRHEIDAEVRRVLVEIGGYMNNLNRPRPDLWERGSLFPFIEDCWGNSVAVVGNKNVIAQRLTAIDEIFEEVHRILKPSGAAQLVPSFLLLRSFSAFRASVMVGLALPTDSYPIQRSCLENAGYAHLISTTPELSERWLNRDDDPSSKSRFTNRAVREGIAASDDKLAVIYQDLYERTIDFGAHPNEKSVTIGLVKGSLDTGNAQFVMLGGDGLALDHGLRTCAQVGICALKVLDLVFSELFAKIDFKEKITKVASPF
jgi:hypothetical protein